jgi:hypothetical protein
MAIMDALRDIKNMYISGPEDGDKPRWAMSSDKYAKRAIDTVEAKLAETGRRLVTKCTTTLANDYRPELDQSPELNEEDQNYYQGLIGVLRWLCELGRIDILVAISLMSRYLVSSGRNHLHVQGGWEDQPGRYRNQVE